VCVNKMSDFVERNELAQLRAAVYKGKKLVVKTENIPSVDRVSASCKIPLPLGCRNPL